MNQKDSILRFAHRCFLESGVKSLTMDDLARKLGKSKKTIYKYFQNKPHLVRETMDYFIEEQKAILKRINKNSSNPIVELAKINEYSVTAFNDVSPNVVFDLQKYYPETWENYLAFKKEFFLNIIRENLRWGTDTGMYRENLDVEIIAHYYIAHIDDVRNPEVFPSGIDFSRLLNEIFQYHIRGIASPRGVNFLEKELDVSF